MKTILSLMTDTELARMERRVWSKMTGSSGYQPFGYDRPTMAITRPDELAALDGIRAEMRSRAGIGILAAKIATATA